MNNIIAEEQSLSVNSDPIAIIPNHTYKISVNIKVIKGKPFSAYFGIIVLNDQTSEVGRYIRWLNDISEQPNEYSIVFRAPHDAFQAIIGCRINKETPLKSDFIIDMPDLSVLNLIETDDTDKESYDDRNKYTVPYLCPLTSADEDLLERKMVWLFGMLRSGTTWLAERLLKHPDSVIWSEPHIGAHLEHCEYRFSPDKSKKNLTSLIDIMDNTPAYFFSKCHRNNWLPALKKFIISRAHSQAQNLSKYLIIKETHCATADIILECFPQSKLIFLLRDGRDCIESLLDVHQKNSWLKTTQPKTMKDRMDLISHYADRWVLYVNTIKKAYDNHDPSLRLLIKYEELRDNTFKELKIIYDFVKIITTDKSLKKTIDHYDFRNIPDSQKGPGKFNRAARTGGWRESFSKDEQDLMNSIMGKTLLNMGYKI